ncbi:hypothetical protein ACWDOP_03920 [Nocardia sp. NPDC003693]
MSALLIVAMLVPVVAVAAGYATAALSWWWAARGNRSVLYPPRFGYVRVEEVPVRDRIRWP